MGCPVDRITRGGSGASMMCRPDTTIDLARRVVEAVGIPVTVKMRLGWDSTQITAPRFAREFEAVGVAAVAIHGRTRAQGFSGQVDRNGIRQVVEAVERIPIIGNGDIRSLADAARMLRETGCGGISIGRGALANPWFFRQLVQWETTGRCDPPGNFEDRLALFRSQFAFLEELRGRRSAIVMFRKTAHWYLKAMRVPGRLRNAYQIANTLDEIKAALREIEACGPLGGDRTGLLPELSIPVPSGPVERW
jgi:nifR3 family TIM-barrel protein